MQLTIRIVFRIKKIVDRVFSIKQLDYNKNQIFIHINNLREYQTRAYSCVKEPETVAWIERSADKTAIFYDIGANIGAYSLVGAANGAQVYAFEPAFQNFYTLNRNISLNRMDGVVHAFPVAFSSQTLIDNFVYLETSSGTSLGFYNQDRKFHRDATKPEVEKATMVFQVDEFRNLFCLPCPTMMKIDVDGAEKEVLLGAQVTLADARLKTLLIEINSAQDDEDFLKTFIQKQGLKLESAHQQGVNTYNYIFYRV